MRRAAPRTVLESVTLEHVVKGGRPDQIAHLVVTPDSWEPWPRRQGFQLSTGGEGRWEATGLSRRSDSGLRRPGRLGW